MKHRTLFIALTALASFFLTQGGLKAQSTSVSGRVVDPVSQRGIPFANVVLVNLSDSTQVTGTASTDSGNFVFKRIPYGRYFIQVAVLGYHRNNSEPFRVWEQEKNIRIDDIPMQVQSIQLEKVVVRAKRPVMEMAPGKITMNVSQSLVTQSDNAFEMLKKFPGVTIDKDDNISLNGKSGVLITIDDRPTHLSGQNLANLLKSMPGNTVEKIEVMTNPSSKYDAEGTGGIINLKTSRIQNTGFSGSVNAGLNVSRTLGYNGGFDLNYRHKKFTIYGNASVYQGKNNSYVYGYNHYENGSRDEQNGSGNESGTPSGKSNFLSFFGQGGIDYYPTRKDVLSLSYRGNGYTGENNFDRLRTRFFPVSGSDSVAYSYNQAALANFSGQDHNLNLNYEHTFDTVYGRKLSINADWSHNTTEGGGSNRITYYPGNFPDDIPGTVSEYSTEQPFFSNIYSLKADYIHPFNMQTVLEAGIKFSYTDNDTRNFYRGADSSSDHFLYDEIIGAAYIMVNHTFKTRTSLQVGVRTEYTYNRGHSISMDSTSTNQYARPFPNISISQPIGMKNTLSLSYRYRLTRPQYDQLNPFLFRSQAQSYQCGNPYLLPQYSHNLDLTYSFNYKFFATLSYIHIDGTYDNFVTYDERMNQYSMPINAGKTDQIALSLNTQLTFFKIWRLMVFVNGSYGRTEMNYGDGKMTSEVFNSTYWINTEIDVHPQLTVSAYSWGNMPSRSLFSTNSGNYGGGVGLKAFFFDRTLTLSASLNAGFTPFQMKATYPGSLGGENVSFSRYDWDRLSGRIQLSYRFGNDRLMERRPREVEQSEESSRISKRGNASGAVER